MTEDTADQNVETPEGTNTTTHRGRLVDRLSPSAIATQTRQNADNLALFVTESLRALAVLYLLAWMTLWVCALIYASFYFNFLPKVSFQVEPHFAYSVDCTHSPNHPPKDHLTVNTKVERFCHFPTSSFSLLHNETLDAFMVQGQQYHLLLELEMPENEVNTNIGVFMAVVSVKEKNREIFTIRRSAALQYKSDLFARLETVALFPLFLGGYRKQSQIVVVDLGIITPPSNDLDTASVILESRDVIVTSANFVGMAKFRGVRYWLYFYPITVAIVSIGALFSFIYPMLALAYFRWRHMMPEYLDLQSYPRFVAARSRRRREHGRNNVDPVVDNNDANETTCAVETRGALEHRVDEANNDTGARRRLNVSEVGNSDNDNHSMSSVASTS